MQRVGREVFKPVDEPAHERERLAVLFADPVGAVARLDEVGERVAVRRQARRPEHDGAHARAQGEIGELVGEGGQLAQLDHVVGRQAGGPEALGGSGGDRVRGRGQVRLIEVETREDHGFAVEALRDIDVRFHHLLG